MLGAPLGDNMMAGTAGVLEAIGRKEGIDIAIFSDRIPTASLCHI